MDKKLNILLLGDFFIDRYHIGRASRLAAEAPIPIFCHDKNYEELGGAGNVAMNLLSLDIKVMAMTFGNKEFVKTIESRGINTKYCLVNDQIETIVKNRYFIDHHLIFRADIEKIASLSEEEENMMISRITDIFEDPPSCIIISDYQKGFLTPKILQAIITEAKKYGVKTLVDPKGKDFSRYKGAYLLKPNKTELSIACQNSENNDLSLQGKHIHEQLELDHLLVTRSEEGMTLFNGTGEKSFAVEKNEVIDVTGAGDTVISTLAYAMLSNIPMEKAVQLSQHAAGHVINKLGCSTVDRSILEKILQRIS